MSDKEKFIAFLQGRILGQIEGAAFSEGIPVGELTLRVAELLRRTASGGELGLAESMSSLPRTSTQAHKGSRKVAVAKRAYRKARRVGRPPKHRRVMNEQARARISAAMKLRWAGKKGDNASESKAA